LHNRNQSAHVYTLCHILFVLHSLL
jgi:hypothetical protein